MFKRIKWKIRSIRDWWRDPCKFNRHDPMLRIIERRDRFLVQHAVCHRCHKESVTVFDEYRRFRPVRSRFVN